MRPFFQRQVLLGRTTEPFSTTLPSFPADRTGLLAWFDPSHTNWVRSDNVLYSTAGFVADLSGNGYDLIQPVKELQPTYDGDSLFFTGAQLMNFYKTTGLLNGVSKYYYAAVVKCDTANVTSNQRQIFNFSKASGTTTNRASFALTGTTSGRKTRLIYSVNDGTESNTAIGTNSATASVWSIVEINVDLTAGTATHYLNGVANGVSTLNATGSTPASDPLVATFGNLNSGINPFLGNIRAAIIQAGGLNANQRADIYTNYLSGRAA